MYLKEAFRYQNYLTGLIRETLSYLASSEYSMKTTYTHNRKRFNPEAEDEIEESGKDREIVGADANALIDFLELLLGEKEKLTDAICAAKRETIDIDGLVSKNKTVQNIASSMYRLCRMRPSERVSRRTDFKLNAEGNQVPYSYEVKEVSVIDFDRNKAKAIAKRLSDLADQTSAKIDRAMVETVVDHTPMFSVNDSYQDAFDAFHKVP